MALSAKVGSFNLDTTKTAGQTQTITGVGFTPKALLLWWSGGDGAGDEVVGEDYSMGFGASDGTTQLACITGSDDANAAGTYYSVGSHNNIIRISSNGTSTSLGTFDWTSFNSDGFVLTCEVQATAAFRIHYLALGGDDLTNVDVGNFAMPTATGNFDITSLAFQPDAVIFLGGQSTTLAGANTNIVFNMGMATGASNQGVASIYGTGAAATINTTNYGYSGEVIATRNTERESFVTFLSNGFTLNHLEGTSARYVFFLALKGGRYSVGNLLTRTDGNDIVETVGFQPKAILFTSTCDAEATQDVYRDHARFSIGAATGASERAVSAVFDEDNVADSETAQGSYDTAVYANIGSDDTIQGLMDLKSIESNGFTCVMDDVDPAQAWVNYLAFGDTSQAITIPLDTAAISAAGQAITVTPGAVSIPLNTAAISAAGQILTVQNIDPERVLVSWSEMTLPTVTIQPTTILLDTATITATGQTITVLPGTATIGLQTASLAASGQNITILKGAVIINLDTAQLVAESNNFIVLPGEKIIFLQTGSLTASGVQITVLPGSISILLDTAILSASGQNLLVLPGGVSILLDTAALSALGQIATVISEAGTITVNLSTASISAAGQNITVLPGGIIINFATASITSAGQPFTVLTYTIIDLQTASLSASGQNISVLPGEVVISLAAGSISALGQALAVQNVDPERVLVSWTELTIPQGGETIIALQTASINAAGQTLNVLPGERIISLNTAILTAGGIQITISISTVILLNTAQLSAAGQPLSVLPGGVAIALQTSTITAAGQAIAILLGGTFIYLNTATINAVGRSISILPGEMTLPLDTAVLAASGGQISVLPGGVSIPLNTAQIQALGKTLSVLPGGVIIQLDTAMATIFGLPITVESLTGIYVFLATAQILAAGQSLTRVYIGVDLTPERTCIIEPQNRILTVEAENRIYVIDSENRICAITYEDRILNIDAENRIFKIGEDL